MDTKYIGGSVVECKEQTNEEGIPIGVVEGYVAAWSVDRGGRYQKPEKFHPGAFNASLMQHKEAGTMVQLKRQHKAMGPAGLIGVFNPGFWREDSVGLWGRGEINLQTSVGKETYSLAKQKALSKFSVGFIEDKDHCREDSNVKHIYKADIVEGSLVDLAMNVETVVTGVKSMIPYQSLPVATKDTSWDEYEAKQRLRQFTSSNNSPNIEYKSAFLWCDYDHPNDFDSCVFPIADVIDGEMKVIPRAVRNAANSLKNSSVPSSDMPALAKTIKQYYGAMGEKSPLESEAFFDLESVLHASTRDLERMMLASGAFSQRAARFVTSQIKNIGHSTIIDELDQFREELQRGNGR